VLEAEVTALREGRALDADALRRAREAAQAPTAVATLPPPDASEQAVIAAEPAPAEPGPAAAAPEIVTPVFADPIVEQAGPAPVAPTPEPAASEPDAPQPAAPEPAPDTPPIKAGEGSGEETREGGGETGATAAVEAVDEKGDSSRA
jgi:hypothetical protein